MVTFTDWIEDELKKRDWKPADLAQRANITDATISRILNGQRQAGPDACIKIADALGVSDVEVFRRRGWLRKSLNNARARDPLLEEMYQLYLKLPIFERPTAIRFLRAFSLMVEMGQGCPSPYVAKCPARAERKENTDNHDNTDPHAPMVEIIGEIWDMLTVEQAEDLIKRYAYAVWDFLPEHIRQQYSHIWQESGRDRRSGE